MFLYVQGHFNLNMKHAKVLLLLAMTAMLIIPMVYAGWFSDWITGKATTRPFNISVSVGNTNPIVDFVQNPGTQTVTEYPGADTSIVVEVHVYDADGVANINTTGTYANITIFSGTSATRSSGMCTSRGNLDANTHNFTCSMPLLYWDTPGNWNITIIGRDISSGTNLNMSQGFQLQDTTALVVHPNELTFPSSTPGATSVMSDNDPLKVNNTANHNVTTGNVRVLAINLIGWTDSGYIIPAANFTANTTDVCGPGTNLVNGTAQTITGSILPPGNISTGVATEDLYFCIKQVPSGISQQSYDTRKGGPWIISVV